MLSRNILLKIRSIIYNSDTQSIIYPGVCLLVYILFIQNPLHLIFSNLSSQTCLNLIYLEVDEGWEILCK